MHIRAFAALACLSAALQIVHSDARAQGRTTETRIGFDLLTSSIKPVAADSAGIGSRAWGAQVTGSLIAFRVLSLNAEGGIIGVSDEASFTQETNLGERTSGVAAGMGTLSAGLRTPPFSTGGPAPFFLSAGVNGGRSWLDMNRTISQCIDCHGEDVAVRAGTFWEPLLQVGTGRGALSARYRMYGGDSDFQDALMIGYSTVAGRRARNPSEKENAPK
jgi:hypothetical protein